MVATAGLLGRKLGMTQIFDERGYLCPVTVLEVGPCTIMQVKTKETDGYEALQLGFSAKRRSRASKPEIGHARKAKAEPQQFIREIRCDEAGNFQAGDTLTAEIFADKKRVDVTGISKGRGFAGVVKRWGFAGLPASHGTSKKHRSPGSIGASSDPSRVFKGTRMPGHMGHVKRTVKKLKVFRVDPERNLLLVKGAVPGPAGGFVTVRAG